MFKRSSIIAILVMFVAASAHAQTKVGFELTSVKSWIFTDSSKSTVIPTGTSSLQTFVEKLNAGIKSNKITIMAEPAGPVGLNAAFHFKQEVINPLQPGRSLDQTRAYDLIMTPVLSNPSKVTLNVQYNSVPAFLIDLQPGEIYVREITVPGQQNRMFLAISANDTSRP